MVFQVVALVGANAWKVVDRPEVVVHPEVVVLEVQWQVSISVLGPLAGIVLLSRGPVRPVSSESCLAVSRQAAVVARSPRRRYCGSRFAIPSAVVNRPADLRQRVAIPMVVSQVVLALMMIALTCWVASRLAVS